MTTLAEINKAAFDALQSAITGAVYTVTLSYETRTTYDPATSSWGSSTTTLTGGRGMMADASAIPDKFPDYIAGPADKLIWLEGFTTSPQEGWTLNFDGTDYTVKRVLDLMGASVAFYVVVT